MRMHGGEEIRGLRVTVTLPAALLTALPEPVRPAATGRCRRADSARPSHPADSAACPADPAGRRPPRSGSATDSYTDQVPAPAPQPVQQTNGTVTAITPAAATPAAAPAAKSDDEKTPIFDTMLSVCPRLQEHGQERYGSQAPAGTGDRLGL